MDKTSFTTKINISPLILGYFNSDMLLDFLARSYKRFSQNVCRLQRKKIRPQDVGKRKEFDHLAKLYCEEYERKKIEKEKWETETKELAKKRSSFSNASSTCRFKRMGSTK